jgi:hypothetical protein
MADPKFYLRRDEQAGTVTWSLQVDDEDTLNLDTLMVWMEAIEFHLEKAKDYQGAEQELGPMAQFVDMSRKWVKIKNALWNKQELTGPEKVPEILFDLMAHIGLTLRMIRRPKPPWGEQVTGPNYAWPKAPTPGS